MAFGRQLEKFKHGEWYHEIIVNFLGPDSGGIVVEKTILVLGALR